MLKASQYAMKRMIYLVCGTNKKEEKVIMIFTLDFTAQLETCK